MPMSRYEIRNEYSLADPELYGAADKDDPEALLEGVAMAGLVGVLRQLGDLAEFAAEIFHNLHNDVMATASRGHVLAFRVQQLEMELPSIETAFLSQTDHSSFFCHPGVVWHPSLQLDNNLVTQGDMPRFIMDSYEECRAPPRLFLLDKFDIAGAGACLKRYTNPSLFKVETSEMSSSDIQREKKIRKAKKKGPRWRNRETREVLPNSHTKLQQLFLEERVENGISTASRSANLKRRLNGFPFILKSGVSYMEKILKSPSPDHYVLRDMTVDSPQPKLATHDHKDASEKFEVRPMSPYIERRGGRKRTTPSSPDGEDVAQNSPTYNSYESLLDGISATLDEVNGEKVVAVGESNIEGSLTDYESEIEKFVDAPSIVESEMDRDSDLRMKRDDTSHKIMESLVTVAYEEPLHSRSSGSHSTGNSTISDAGNNSSTKKISSFSSDSPSISAEKPQSKSSLTQGFQCTAFSVNEIVDAVSYQETTNEVFPVHHSETGVPDDVHVEADAPTNHMSKSKQVSSNLCNDGSIPSLMHSDLDAYVRRRTLKSPESDEKLSILYNEEDNTDPTMGPRCALSDPEEVVGDHMLETPRSDEMVSMTDDEEKMMNLVIIPPFSPSACVSGTQPGDNLSSSSNREQLVDKPNDESALCLSISHETYHHTTDGSVKTSSNFLYEYESDGEDQKLADDAASTLDIPDVLSTNGAPDTMYSGKQIEDKLEDEFQEVPENCRDDPDGKRNGDNVEPKGDDFTDVCDNEASTVSIDSLNHSPCIMKASLEKGLEESSLASAHTLTVEDHHYNSSNDDEIRLGNLKLSHLTCSPDTPIEGLDAHDKDVIPEADPTINETLGTPISCEVVGLQGKGISYHVSPSEPEVEMSHSTSEILEEPAGVLDDVENDGMLLLLGSNTQEVTEITNSADFQPVNEIPGSEADTANTTDITSPMPAVSDDASPSKLVEEHNDCFEDSGIHEIENDKNCPFEGGSEDLEKMGLTEASASDGATIVCNCIDNDHTKSELSGLVPNSDPDLESDHSLEVDHAAMIQSPSEQCGLDREQELEPVNKSGLENRVPDSPSLLVENPPSISEISRLNNNEITIPGYPKHLLASIPPPSNPFLEGNQINLSDIPPLPPLPPVQWRMGKLQHALPSAEEEMIRNEESFPQSISPKSAAPDVGSTLSTEPTQNSSSPPTASTGDIISLREDTTDSWTELAAETIPKEENLKNNSSNLEPETNHVIENKPRLLATPIPEGVSTSSAAENGAENGSQRVKFSRPHTPLVDDASFLDKSKLRKVTERVRPELPKVEEQDSLLEQIRTKSFNLKPAMTSRPSIRARDPNTNLQVVAILEKANAIRQAFAGSDEDDEDSWSE